MLGAVGRGDTSPLLLQGTLLRPAALPAISYGEERESLTRGTGAA